MEANVNAGFENEKTGGGGGGFLSVDNSEVNSHTYVYEPDKSLRKMTIEALPTAENYQDLKNIAEYRPTLDELMLGKVAEKEEIKEEIDARKGKVIKFGWVEGVMMRCLLNIWGTMLFLRLTWVVGQAGIWQGLLVITLCNVVTWLSALSMSAISTNGQIAAGGVYYMISRSLGPVLGGSIGLMFTMANTISVGTYTVGFATSVSDLLQDAVPGWDGIVDHGCRIAGCRDNDIRIIGGPVLCLFLFIAFAGMDWVTRIQKALLVLLMLAQCDMFAGSFLDIEWGTGYVQKDSEGKISLLTQDQRHAYGFSGWSMETAKENFNPSYRDSSLQKNPGFFDAFGVFFTAVTGIVAGANLSGDLKDPSYSIPKGTLLAIVFTYITYMYFALQTGCVFNNRASGISEEYRYFNNRGKFIDEEGNPLIPDPLGNTFHNSSYIMLPKWVDCEDEANDYRDYLKFQALPAIDATQTAMNESWVNLTSIYDKWNTDNNPLINGTCTFGSGQNQMTMTYISFTGWLRYAGGFSASLSSAIASMVGAPRILQAVGKDGIYPGIGWFEKGYTANNDPWRGYILVFVVAMGFVMVAKLNAIGIIASNFFLAAYALMNLSCFHSSYTNSPGWRPSFKYYNKWVSLFSAFLCVALMFIMDWRYATGTVLIQAVLGAYIYYANPEANWGSSADAQTFMSAMNSTQQLTDSPDHVKTYRPKILLLTGNPAHRPSLVDFGNIITKKISLLICGQVLKEEGPVNLANLKDGMQNWMKDHNIKGYYSVAQNKDLSAGAKSCMTISGLGKLSPNMVMMGFKANWKQDLAGLNEYVEIMYTAFDLHMSFAILRCKEGLDFSSHIASEQQIIREVPVGKGEDSDGEEAPKNTLAEPAKQKTRKVSTAVYRGSDGNRLDNNVIASIRQFQATKRTGNIDVWWLYDDGGLTLLLPHIIKTRKQFKDCKIRVFSLANNANQLDLETRNMASMLSRFRIDYADVTAVPDVTKKADPATKAEFDALISGVGIEESELQSEREKTNRHLRLTEMLRQYSKDSELVVMTLPLPRRGHTSPALYTAWLDIMTKDMPPTLLIRGNQQSVLTFYS
eukprot:GFUD01011283.1.p1 GENE.GFUD01011283.1~~GFUD01011283.1.p1  ORF type:complete len:1082 (+),score=181.23 GFUD01011283.1:264-3509(+)